MVIVWTWHMDFVARIATTMATNTYLKTTSHNTQKDRLSVDRKAYIATLDGKPLELTLKEFELLSYLLENSGQVISRDRRRIRHLQHRPQKLAYKIPQVGACGILC